MTSILVVDDQKAQRKNLAFYLKSQGYEVEDCGAYIYDKYDDYPDFCDSFICSAEWDNGEPLTDFELDEVNENRDFVHESLINQLY